MTEPKSSRLKDWRSGFISLLLFLVFFLLRLTWRIKEDSYPKVALAKLESGKNLVLAHLHEDEWAFLGCYAFRPLAVLVSLSADGGVMARFLTRLGFSVIRGSSSRGGAVGLLSMIRLLKRRKSSLVSLAVDGPRGPRGEAKLGIFKLAASLDSPIVVGGVFSDRSWVFKRSWSQAYIPKPFARIRVVYQEPIEVDWIKAKLDANLDAELTGRANESLASAKSMAAKAFALNL